MEGIIIGKWFVPKEIFKEVYQYYLKEYGEKKIIPAIEGVLNVIDNTKVLSKEKGQEFKTAWQNFSNTVLLREPDLQLMIIYRGSTSNSSQFSNIINGDLINEGVHQVYDKKTGTKKQIKRYGIVTQGDTIQKSFELSEAAQKIENYLRKHYQGFQRQLSVTIGKQLYDELWLYKKKFMLDRWKEMKEAQIVRSQIKNLNWLHLFYKETKGKADPRTLGKFYDAFMNHVADKERDVYQAFSQQTVPIDNINQIINKKESVYEEEGGFNTAAGHFPDLLGTSKNHLAWYTGGDIVIVNPDDNTIAYNIQLKTTTVSRKTTFGVALDKLAKNLQEIKSIFKAKDSNAIDLAVEKIYQTFKTESSNQLNTCINNTLKNDLLKLIPTKV